MNVPGTITDFVVRAAAAQPGRQAFVFEDGVGLSCAELLERSERFAGYLREITAPGEMVAVMLPNRCEFMIAWLATVACGCVFVALNPEAGQRDLLHILRDSGAVALLLDSTGEQELRDTPWAELPALRERLVLGEDEPDGLARFSGSEPLAFDGLAPDPSEITNVYYTSGTTGLPKGCMVSHAYWQRLVTAYLADRGLEPEDRMLCCLKFFYNDPSWQLLTSLHVGATLVVMRRFSVSRFWRIVHDSDITQLFTIGSIPALLLSAPPSPLEREHHVRFGVHVAIDRALHPEMVDRWGIPWIDSYGLTETGGVIGVPLSDALRVIGSGTIGRPRTGVEVRLVAPDAEHAGADDTGELTVRAPVMMSGYLNNPSATAAAIDSDGFFHTGDLVRRDADGWFYFVGRQKEIIRRAGENISATEVEDALRAHPAVIDVAAVPVADTMRGEEVLVHIFTSDPPGAALALALWSFAQEQLARHKVPRYVVFRSDDFPRTASMRVAKMAIARGEVPAGAHDREHQDAAA